MERCLKGSRVTYSWFAVELGELSLKCTQTLGLVVNTFTDPVDGGKSALLAFLAGASLGWVTDTAECRIRIQSGTGLLVK